MARSNRIQERLAAVKAKALQVALMDLFLAPQNLLFSVAILVMLGLTAVEAVSVMLGGGRVARASTICFTCTSTTMCTSTTTRTAAACSAGCTWARCRC